MIRNAIILAAGYGTRFLPVTRVVPKELLPILARPALDLVLEELAEAGVERVCVITSRRKRAVEDWFDRDPELEAVFSAEGATDKLERIRPPRLEVTFVRQQRMMGTGHALLLARAFAGDEPALVAFPDDLFHGPNPSLALVEAWRASRTSAADPGASVLAVQDLRGEDVSRYGVLDVEAGGAPWRVRGVVEKPPRGTEPSTLVSVGRFLYTPALFDALERHAAAHTAGEYYPMPAMMDLAARGQLLAAPVAAARYDTGTPLGYLQAVVDAALRDPHLRGPFQRWLDTRADEPATAPPRTLR
jgi:UTP--glucose-1-phosphate uridylyltransferase